MWLAPSLLLLDIMAQPVVAFVDEEQESESDSSCETELSIGKGEIAQMREDHKNQTAALSTLAHSLFSALRDGSDKIMDIYSIMGEWDLLVRIEHPDLNSIQKVVTETIRANPNVAQTYTILGYQLYGSKWPGFDYPDSK